MIRPICDALSSISLDVIAALAAASALTVLAFGIAPGFGAVFVVLAILALGFLVLR